MIPRRRRRHGRGNRGFHFPRQNSVPGIHLFAHYAPRRTTIIRKLIIIPTANLYIASSRISYMSNTIRRVRTTHDYNKINAFLTGPIADVDNLLWYLYCYRDGMCSPLRPRLSGYIYVCVSAVYTSGFFFFLRTDSKLVASINGARVKSYSRNAATVNNSFRYKRTVEKENQ